MIEGMDLDFSMWEFSAGSASSTRGATEGEERESEYPVYPLLLTLVIDGVQHTWSCVDFLSSGRGCHIWRGKVNQGGYGHVHIHRRCSNATVWYCRGDSPWRSETTYVTRLVLEDKMGRPMWPDMLACHTCDNPSCVNPDHLYEGTHTDNYRDMVERGRGAWQQPGPTEGRALTHALKRALRPMRAHIPTERTPAVQGPTEEALHRKAGGCVCTGPRHWRTCPMFKPMPYRKKSKVGFTPT
jgi:hypothetical protein